MLTKFSNNTIFSDSLLYSFLIDTIKQHCTLYNFSSIQTPLCQRNGSLRTDAYANLIDLYQSNNQKQTPWNVCTHGPVFRQKNNTITPIDTCTFAAINAPTVAYYVYFITMLDVLFSERLKLENYVLKINAMAYTEQALLLEMLSFHAVNYVIDQTLTRDTKNVVFSFTSQELEHKNFCSGSVWTHTHKNDPHTTV